MPLFVLNLVLYISINLQNSIIYTLKRKRMTSPSFTTYSLPSIPTSPFSLAAAREKGLVGMEGKDYVVKDGDVILFRFNV